MSCRERPSRVIAYVDDEALPLLEGELPCVVVAEVETWDGVIFGGVVVELSILRG